MLDIKKSAAEARYRELLEEEMDRHQMAVDAINCLADLWGIDRGASPRPEPNVAVIPAPLPKLKRRSPTPRGVIRRAFLGALSTISFTSAQEICDKASLTKEQIYKVVSLEVKEGRVEKRLHNGRHEYRLLSPSEQEEARALLS